MALRGKLSSAHEYNNQMKCIHCGMYRWNVVLLSHVCTAEREDFVDKREALKKENSKKEVKEVKETKEVKEVKEVKKEKSNG